MRKFLPKAHTTGHRAAMSLDWIVMITGVLALCAASASIMFSSQAQSGTTFAPSLGASGIAAETPKPAGG
ncbi:MAG: hypothetical protein AAFR53_13720 [Pseudomonadota bacterium]